MLALLIVRLLLAATFALAAVTKFADPVGSRRALADFGAPPRWVVPLAVVLPSAELSVAVALVPRATARLAGIGALVLLAVFTAAIARSLAQGRRPDCHCFGQLHSQPVGWKVLARNGLLAAAALALVAAGGSDPGPSAVAWLEPLSGFERAVVLGGALVAALGATQVSLLLRLSRQNRELLAQRSVAAAPTPAGLPVGDPAPEFSLPSLDDGTVTLGSLCAAGKPLVLLFTDTACVPCRALMPEVAGWQRDHAEAFTLAVISSGTPAATRLELGAHGVRSVLLQRGRTTSESFRVKGTPSGCLVLPDGRIGRPLAQGEAEIRSLIAAAARWEPAGAAAAAPPPAPVLSEPAPELELRSLDGEVVTLQRFRGAPTLVLFWNPACGYCRRMLDDLKAWESRPQGERQQLLVVATGSEDATRGQGLASTVVLDPSFSVARRYGVRGTPSGVLVDEDGRIASAVTVGGSPLLALIGQPESATAAVGEEEASVDAAPTPRPTSLPAGARPLRKECVTDVLLHDATMVLYNGCGNEVLSLNPTAALIWECCDGDNEIADIAEEVRKARPSVVDAERDVRELVDRLLQADMIQPAPAEDLQPLLSSLAGD